MKKGLSLPVVCPKGRLPKLSWDEAVEERPDAQDWKISAVWQALFSSCSKIDWFVPFWALLAGRGDAGLDAGAAEHEEDRSRLQEPSLAAVDWFLLDQSPLGWATVVGRDGPRHPARPGV